MDLHNSIKISLKHNSRQFYFEQILILIASLKKYNVHVHIARSIFSVCNVYGFLSVRQNLSSVCSISLSLS